MCRFRYSSVVGDLWISERSIIVKSMIRKDTRPFEHFGVTGDVTFLQSGCSWNIQEYCEPIAGIWNAARTDNTFYLAFPPIRFPRKNK